MNWLYPTQPWWIRIWQYYSTSKENTKKHRNKNCLLNIKTFQNVIVAIPYLQAPYMIVNGGAWSGKSTLINLISQYTHQILKRILLLLLLMKFLLCMQTCSTKSISGLEISLKSAIGEHCNLCSWRFDADVPHFRSIHIP